MGKRSSYENLPGTNPAIPQRVVGTVAGLVAASAVPDGRIGPETAGQQPLVVRTHYMPGLYRMRLTPHFQLREFLHSRLALENDIDNTPADRQTLENLLLLATAMEAVRAALMDAPVKITSGYRCEAVNDLCGGVPNSFHRKGLAADFTAPHFGTPEHIFQLLSGDEDNRTIAARSTIARLRLEPGWVHLVARDYADPDAHPPRYSIDPRCAAHSANAPSTDAPPPAAAALLGARSKTRPRTVVPEGRAIDALARLGLGPQPNLFTAA